jgi:hypothetical protein
MDLGVTSMFSAWTSPLSSSSTASSSSAKPTTSATSTPQTATRKTSRAHQVGLDKYTNELSDIDSYFGANGDTKTASSARHPVSPATPATPAAPAPAEGSSLFGLGTIPLGIVGVIGGAIGALESTLIDSTRTSAEATDAVNSKEYHQHSHQHQHHHRVTTIADEYYDNEDDSDVTNETSSGSDDSDYSGRRNGSNSKTSSFRRNNSRSRRKVKDRSRKRESSEGFRRVTSDDGWDLPAAGKGGAGSTSDQSRPPLGAQAGTQHSAEGYHAATEMLRSMALMSGSSAPASVSHLEGVYELRRTAVYNMNHPNPDSTCFRLVPVADIPLELRNKELNYRALAGTTTSRNGAHDALTSAAETANSSLSANESPQEIGSVRLAAVSSSSTPSMRTTREVRSSSDGSVFEGLPANNDNINHFFVSDSEDECSKQQAVPTATVTNSTASQNGQYPVSPRPGLDSLRHQLSLLEETNKKLHEEIEFLISSPLHSNLQGHSGGKRQSRLFKSTTYTEEGDANGASNSPTSDLIGIAMRFSSKLRGVAATEEVASSIDRRSIICIYCDYNSPGLEGASIKDADAAGGDRAFYISLKSIRTNMLPQGSVEYWYDIGMDSTQFVTIADNRPSLFKVSNANYS